MKYICGKNSVLDAIKNNVSIKTLFVLKEIKFDNKNIKEIKVITKQEMNELTNTNHQGFVALLEKEFEYYDINKMFKDKPNIILILDHIEDPQNLGAIIRTVNACGIKYIILPKDRASSINETVFKVSSGGMNNVNISRTNSIQSTIEKLKKMGYWIYATTIENGISYANAKYNFPLALIIGNEAKGISKSLLKQSDQNIFIPMYGSVQSLNASVATGVVLFEIIKNKK